jgi:nucleoside-diphosphate-sugar epimerase
MSERILVVGGQGALGSALIDLACQRNQPVRALSWAPGRYARRRWRSAGRLLRRSRFWSYMRVSAMCFRRSRVGFSYT